MKLGRTGQKNASAHFSLTRVGLHCYGKVGCMTSILAVALTAISCSDGESHIQTRSLPSPNPTSYVFSLPIAETHEKAWQAFSIEHQTDRPIFDRSGGLGFEDTLFAECATNAVFGEAIFRDPANTNDFYLQSFDQPFEISPIYYGSTGPLPFIGTFHLHLAASRTNTMVTVIASHTEVVAGTKFGFGPCGPGRAYVYVSVKPTTIEEYSILRYLGNYIGVTNMPPVILPKSRADSEATIRGPTLDR